MKFLRATRQSRQTPSEHNESAMTPKLAVKADVGDRQGWAKGGIDPLLFANLLLWPADAPRRVAARSCRTPRPPRSRIRSPMFDA